MRRAGEILVLLALAAGCASSPAPASLSVLEKMVAEAPEKGARDGSVEAWGEAERYLRLSKEALDGGHVADADRLAVLGELHARLAVVAQRERDSGRDVDALDAAHRELSMEVERVEGELDRLMASAQRERIRAHVELVVDEARRRAAAREELEEERLGEDERGALESAREEVGAQVIDHQQIAAAALGLYRDAGFIEPERVAPVDGALELARGRLEEGDIAGVQEYAERAGVEALRAMERLWERVGEGAREAALASVKEAIEASAQVGEDETVGLSFAVPVSKRAKVEGKWEARLKELAARLEKLGAVVLVVSRDKGAPFGKRPKDADDRARAVARVIEAGGVSGARIEALSCGASSPLAVFAKKAGDVAVVVIPVPAR